MMKKLLLFLAIFSSAISSTRAQTNTCHGDWGQWINVYTFADNINFRMSFKYLLPTKQGCTESYYRFDNPVPRPGAYLKFKFSYKKQDGTVGIQNMERVELDRTGIRQDNTANWYLGYDMIRIYDIQYVDPNKDKVAKSLGIKPPALPAPTHQDSLKAKLPKMQGDAMGRRADNTNTPSKPVVQSTALNSRKTEQQLRTALAGVNIDPQKNTPKGGQPQSAAITSGSASSQTDYVQQFQQWQKTNQQTQQTISSAFDGLKNQVQQAYEQRAAERDEKYARDMQKLKNEQQEREAAQENRLNDTKESNRQTGIDMDDILKYSDDSGLPHYERLAENAKQSFYITYERDYGTNVITLKTYTLNKYSDGTWMLAPDITKKIGFTKYMGNLYRYTDLLGPYSSKASALTVINKIKTNAGGIASSFQTDDGFLPINKPANVAASKDFWNN